MVTYGDDLANLDILRPIESHQEMGKIAPLSEAHPSSKSGLVEANVNKLIIPFKQKPGLEELCKRRFYGL